MDIKRGDVIIARLPYTNRSVQAGKRHCLIVQNDKGNMYSPTTQIVALTTKEKKPVETHLTIVLDNGELNTVLCEQIITISKEDIRSVEQHLDDNFMRKVDKS